jgi:cytochrome c556
MKRNLKILAVVIFLTLGAGAVFAQMLPETMIRMRKAGYDFSAWNMSKIRGMVEYSPASFKKDQVVAAANAVAAIANSGMSELYAPGTEKDVGGQKTNVKPELFQERDKVKKLELTYIKEANNLQRVARGGDMKAISVQLGKLVDACSACHDRYRKKD